MGNKARTWSCPGGGWWSKMADDIDRISAELVSKSEELQRIVLAAGWVNLAEAAKRLGISKGSVSSAVRRRAIRSVRLLPGFGRGSVLTLLDPEEIRKYKPRDYPGSHE